MIYFLENYSTTFHPTKSERTVRRMISAGLVPSNHIIIRNKSQFVINVCETRAERLSVYAEFAIFFNKNCERTLSSANDFCMENNLQLSLFVKIVAV